MYFFLTYQASPSDIFCSVECMRNHKGYPPIRTPHTLQRRWAKLFEKHCFRDPQFVAPRLPERSQCYLMSKTVLTVWLADFKVIECNKSLKATKCPQGLDPRGKIQYISKMALAKRGWGHLWVTDDLAFFFIFNTFDFGRFFRRLGSLGAVIKKWSHY